ARMKAGSTCARPAHRIAAARALAVARRMACSRGCSPLRTLSSMSAGRMASGTMPARARRAARRGLSLARTSAAFILPEAVIDTTLGEVVGRHFHHHLVAGQHPNAVLAHLAGGVGDDDMAIGDQLHAERRIGQKLIDDSL